MTSTTGMDAHPEVSEISDLAEGLLPPGRSADVRDHLDGCDLCSDVRTSLDEIRNLLGTLPGPPRMPADIAGRIDAALAAEALLDSTAPATVPRGTVDASLPQGTVPTAADRPSGHAPASTGPGRGHRARPRRRWARTLLVTASTAAVLGLGGVLLHSLDAGSAPHDAAQKDMATNGVAQRPGGSAEAKRNSSGAGDLQTRVRDLLGTQTSVAGVNPESPANGSDTPALTPLRTHSVPLPPCVKNGIHRTEQPLASAHEPYEGTDAYLVVLPHPGDPAHVDLYVVDASCTTEPGQVLRQGTYAH
ncbi:hypothetical protein [Streptomyces sp. SPB162]|uniref:hypothetical protein n=1 Tax=Streptomyces sp. SPB162 TaxID=2940560 RepID=UPI0024050E65|nr:hypothetical protein [Streptomyces sp. SPB162]MDF9814375.1 hypothetical protein [Streptomyces sp. SPB162]